MIKRLDALSHRVDDLLRYAKPRTPQLRRVPIKPLMDSTIALVHRDQAMASLEITVTGDSDVAARADAELLREVFLNLLINAGQAIEGRGTVRVTIGGGAMAAVRIIDAGPGLSPDLQGRAFEPFFTTKRSGTGLGLAIVRRLLELQNGAVTIESSSAAGTTMLVVLPTDTSQPATSFPS